MNKSRHDGAQFIYVRGSLRGLNDEVQILNIWGKKNVKCG